jgi:D-glycero-alpha-D-manno-heptose-7-phosphate kinase
MAVAHVASAAARGEPMIISRTPLRVSFAGGGSDLATFYQLERGAVVTTAIRKYIYITVNRKFDSQIRASYSVTEIVDRVDDLKHELIRECLKLLAVDGGIEITSISDIPSRGTGLGSSSTYTVGLLNAVYSYLHQHVGAERLAREACQIEIERCGKPIGKQDQYIAAYGGLQYVQFNSDGSVYVDPIICRPQTRQTLQSRLLLLYTGQTRAADSILSTQSQTCGTGAPRQAMRRMVELATQLRDALNANDLDAFGEILHESWMAKRSVAPGIATPAIDAWYDTARAHGATGGKIAGAGGGGFLLLYAPEERHADIRRALPELTPMPFVMEPQGSKVIYVESPVD